MVITKRKTEGIVNKIKIKAQETKHTSKYLGVHLDRGLPFLKHVKDHVDKANRMILIYYCTRYCIEEVNCHEKIKLENTNR